MTALPLLSFNVLRTLFLKLGAREGPKPGLPFIALFETVWGCCIGPTPGVSHGQDVVQQIRSSDNNQQ